MAYFLRMLLGVLLLPACWGVSLTFIDSVKIAAGGNAFSPECIALLGGLTAFFLCWMAVPHPFKTYVLGHELTHALWGLLFGAVPSDLKVGANGGSVRLTKSNMLITLAPYFFPFYTFVVIVCALITYAFFRPLPWLPLWMFMIGFTWAFHVLFTFETLTREQPDVKLYGRIFSWTFIFLVNVLIVLIWVASVSSLTFGQLLDSLLNRQAQTYAAVFSAFVWLWRSVMRMFKHVS